MIPAGPPGMATKAQLPLLGPLGLEPLQQLCSGGWVVLKSSILRKAWWDVGEGRQR